MKNIFNNISGIASLLVFAILFTISSLANAIDFTGRTEGHLSCSPTGGAVYTIPIALRDGYGDLTPQLSITYNSQAGNGIMGLGWSLTGLSSITAGGKTKYHDDVSTAIGINGNDTYYLDGQRLILKSGINGKKNAQYVTEEESFCKIYIDSAFTSTPKSFVVKKPDGSTYKYGSTYAGIYRYPYSTSQAAYSWLLDYVEDKDGNCIKYNYIYYNNIPLLNYISYGSNKNMCPSSYCNVYLDYDSNRTDTIVSYVKSNKYLSTNRLKSIRCMYYGGVQYRKYAFVYNNNGYYSKLESVKEYGTNSNGYAPTLFEWKNLPSDDADILPSSFGVILPQDALTHENSYFVTGDINRDGRTDIITISPHSNFNSTVRVFYDFNSDSKTFCGEEDYLASRSYQYSHVSYSGFFNKTEINAGKLFNGGLIGHFSKSKKNSLVIPKYAYDEDGNHYALFELPLDSGRVGIGYEAHNRLAYTSEMPAYSISDFDRDGNDVIMYIEKKSLNDKLIRLNFIDFDFNREIILRDTLDLVFSSLPNDEIKECLVQDFNGDSFPDILVLCNNYSIMLWNCDGTFTAASSCILNYIKASDTVCPCDLNGDGLIDLLVNTKNSNTWIKAINIGTNNSNIFNISNARALSNLTARRHGDSDNSYYCVATDFDCDGLSDFIIGYKYNNTARIAWVHTMRNGSMSVIRETSASSLALSTLPKHISLGDFDGDGVIEMLTYGADLLTGSADGSKPCRMYKNALLGPDLQRIVQICDGYGKTSSISYNSLGNSGYTNAATANWPMMRFSSSMSVMTGTVDSCNGADYETHYSYANGLTHAEGKGFLCFERMISESNGLKTICTSNVNSDYYTPYMSSVKVTDISGMHIKSLDSYSYTYTNNGTIAKSYIKQLSRESHKDNTDNTSEIIEYSNYHYGVPATVSYNPGCLLSCVKTCTFRDVITGDNWIIGLPLAEHCENKSERTYNESPDFFYTMTSYQYDINNRIVQKKEYASNVDEQWNLTSTQNFRYNSGGKLLENSSIAYSCSDTLISTYGYDLYGRMIQECAPDGNVTTYTYNNVGLMSQKYNAWSATRENSSYDAMGRFVRSIKTSVNNTFTPDTTSIIYTTETGYPLKKIVKSTLSPQCVEYYDGFGRKVADGVLHFNECEYVTESTYGDCGTIEFVSEPHIKGTQAEHGTTYVYDEIQRPIEVIDADGVSLRTEYNGNNKSITDKGVETTYVYDGSGLLLEKINDDSGDIYYYYKAGGRYDRIALYYLTGNDVFSVYEYDRYGRLTKLTDPNGNVRRNVYNSAGRIYRQYFDYNYESYTYNKYGDIITKTYRPNGTDVTTVYTYDSKRRLVNVSGNNYSESYTYNDAGQILSKTNSVTLHEDIYDQDRTYTKISTYTYAGLKNLSSVSNELDGLSTPVVESYRYQQGWMKEILFNGKSVWNLTGEDNHGRTSSTSNWLSSTMFTYGNSGRILNSNISVNATVTGHERHLTHTYSYDEYGRLAIKDGKTFEYDNQNRLVNWNGQEYSYDDFSNITMEGAQNRVNYNTYKLSSVLAPVNSVWGNYRLIINNNVFNQPCRIEKIVSGIPSQSGVMNFNYDSNGRRISMSKYGYLSFEHVVNNELVGPDLECDFIRAYVDDNYEIEDCIPADPIRYYYIGGDSHTACAIAKIYNDEIHLMQIGRDYQGSITSLVDSTSVKLYYYTPWGNYCASDGTVNTPIYNNGANTWDTFFYRGFMGQEHYTDYGLINLNARMYNPYIGRFLSPDPVYDASRSILDFNPYVYGKNNPSMYMDPDGKLPVLAWVGIGLLGFEAANLGIELVTNICQNGLNVSEYNWNQTINAWKIDMGMFKGTFGQVVNKWTFGFGNSVLGNLAADLYNIFGKVDEVSDMDGMLALSGPTGISNAAVTIGHYSMGPKGYKATWKDNLFVHEYGHYIQTQRMGAFWFPVVGFPSLLSAARITSKKNGHNYRWFEQDASATAAHYFDKHYGRGAAGYIKDSKDYFDISYFYGKKERTPPYQNPRWQYGISHVPSYPLKKPSISFWDFFL